MSGNIVNSHYTTHSLFSCGGILGTVSLHFLKLMSYCFLGWFFFWWKWQGLEPVH